jgi:RNA polymerase sigma-70 factor (ECF subfamily)
MPVEDSVIEARKGNQRAFKRLFEENVNIIYRFLYQFSKNPDQVEDWTQRAFIKAFENINRFEGNSKFSTWLIKIGINEMKTDFARVKDKKTVFLEDEQFDSAVTVEEEFEWKQDMKWLLSELDEFKRSVFILFEVEGYSHSEIADIMNISESLSRTTLCRVKNQLKEKWIKSRGKYD